MSPCHAIPLSPASGRCAQPSRLCPVGLCRYELWIQNTTSGSMSTMRDGGELAKSLTRQVEGEVLFDLFSRGRTATDSSIYQVLPLGVVEIGRASCRERVCQYV